MLQLWTAGDATSVVPWARWDFEAASPGEHAFGPRFGAFLPDSRVASFDCAALGIAPGEARSVDPQQRMLLEVSGSSWSRHMATMRFAGHRLLGGLKRTHYVRLRTRARTRGLV